SEDKCTKPGGEESPTVPKPKSRINEVVPLLENERRQRRKITAERKNRILDQADACKRGELGELLRREGIYASQLTSWRAQREQNGLAGLAGSRPGPKPSKDSKDRLIENSSERMLGFSRSCASLED